jgi:hypothetical protein
VRFCGRQAPPKQGIQYSAAPVIHRNASYYWITRFRG